MKKSVIRSFKKWATITKLRVIYANQLKRQNNLSINTLEGNIDYGKVVNSRYLIGQGIEPTEENLQKMKMEINEQIVEWNMEHPPVPKQEIEKYTLTTAATEKFRITLRAARVNRGLTLKNVAALTGKSAKTIGRYEIDSSNIYLNLTLQLANLYRVPLDMLYIGPEINLFNLDEKEMSA
ncbi:helix-turn-helix domain-containing protein [Desulfosporosinus lacus]|uniref:Helix-turn-helix domain-containing protein n=1 Tax=Desulfosporosinus lacus DSM 15449 TaxID=1121420 RepID=A0A1M5WFA8_9FIRM|nr:helix-turn-helix transcriptional regulator [Desulfosporosinus lacus]SHH85923.1 Helix-turn-helix domain-containing protein [Desulfosporosinus lacus DSM 15449]